MGGPRGGDYQSRYIPAMTTSPVLYQRWADVPLEPVTDQISRKLITGQRMMLAHVYLKKGAVVPKH